MFFFCFFAAFSLNLPLFCLFLQGIVRALKEFQVQLKEKDVSIFVRRGGPNYQEGLRVMREVGKWPISKVEKLSGLLWQNALLVLLVALKLPC